MRALVQAGAGGVADLALDADREPPVAGRGDYLVRVEAAGVNFADVMQAQGRYDRGPTPPYVAGFEAAGEIIAVGEGLDNPLAVGTRVVGTGPGAFAELMAMPAADVMPVPVGWTSAESLGFVLNWATALGAVRLLGEVAVGDVVLVHAAAGGVGQAAVRLAEHFGATVVATASPAKHALLRDLGVTAVFDARSPCLARDILDEVGQVDVVLESVGRATMRASLAVTKPISGRIVVFGSASGVASLDSDDLVFHHPVQVKGLHIGRLAETLPAVHADLVSQLHELIAQGVYVPGTPRVHPLLDGPRVLRALELGLTHGKHAIDPRL